MRQEETKMSSWDGKPRQYAAFKVTDVDDLTHFVRIAGCGHFIFRGQPDYHWPLLTRIERDISEPIKEAPGLCAYERMTLDQFRRRAHHYLPAAEHPPGDDPSEWLAFIRHYGGPTRLLDVTWSIFIAAYFAIGHNNKAPAASIYAINAQALSQTVMGRRAEYISIHCPKSNVSEPLHDNLQILDHSITHGCGGVPAAIIFQPFRQNRRLLQQQALFLASLSLDRSFQENLFASLHGPVGIPQDDNRHQEELEHAVPLQSVGDFREYAVLRLLIPQTCYLEMKDLPYVMNISADTLYPDLAGQLLALEELMPRS
jgi:hypothetical protein